MSLDAQLDQKLADHDGQLALALFAKRLEALDPPERGVVQDEMVRQFISLDPGEVDVGRGLAEALVVRAGEQREVAEAIRNVQVVPFE